MFGQWFSKLAPVHKAESADEKEAIFRFRFQVLEEEGYRAEPAGLDQSGKRVTDVDDHAARTTLLYTGRSPEVTGTVRLRTWAAGAVPEDVALLYSLERFPGIQELSVAEVGRFLIRPSLRGTLLLPSLVSALYDQLLAQPEASLFFTCVAPELVPIYRKLGLRPYGGRLVDTGDGLAVPLVGIPTDVEFLKRCESPAYPLVRDRLAKRTGTAASLAPVVEVIESAQTISVDPDDVWMELQEDFFAANRAAPVIFQGLGDEAIRYLSEHGFILDTHDGLIITREQANEREVFVVLEGTFEATIKGQQVGVMGKGDTFGELAFFRQTGRRVATVTAVGSGRLLVLGRTFLDNLIHEQGDLAAKLLFNLGRLMAERLTK